MSINPQFKGVNILLPVACDFSYNWIKDNKRIPMSTIVFEIDTNRMKVGVEKKYNETDYVVSGESLFTPAMQDMLNKANQPGGVLLLNDDGKIPIEFTDFDISSLKGDKGEDGDSAYQIAVNNGFIGNEEEWLESLKGEQGEPGDGSVFNNTNPTVVSWGQISAGTNIDGMTFKDFILTQYYPYQAPAFTSFSAIGINTTQEVGVEIPANLTFSYTVSNTKNINGTFSIIDMSNSNITVANNISSSPVISTSSSIRKSTVGTHKFRIKGMNTNNVEFYSDLNINFKFAIYWGESSDESMTSTKIHSLRVKTLKDNFTGTYNFNAGGYKYFCYPASWQFVTGFKDVSTGLGVAMNTPITITVTSNEVAIPYLIYRTTNEILTDLSIIIS